MSNFGILQRACKVFNILDILKNLIPVEDMMRFFYYYLIAFVFVITE